MTGTAMVLRLTMSLNCPTSELSRDNIVLLGRVVIITMSTAFMSSLKLVIVIEERVYVFPNLISVYINS